MKPIEKKDTDNSSSDSEYSDEIKHNTFSKTHNIFTTSPLFQGKGRDSKDEQDNSSMKYLSLIESTNEENAKNDHKKKEKEDNDNSSCDSESSYETKLIHTLDNRTHINGPLFSSTPNSDHTINNIGLGRNKLQEQLRKHLAKNKITKQKSFDSVKSPSKLIKDNHSQYNNITKDIKIDENESNITATLVDNNQNIDIMDNMKLQNNMQSDSVINSNNLKKKKFSINNSIKCSPIKLKKSTKKNQNSNVSVGTILNYFSPDKDKCTTNVTKNNLSIDCNADHVKNNEVKNTMYKQEKHDSISPGNTDPDKLNNFKSPCKPIVKFLSKMTLNTKNFSPKNKDIIVDSKNKIENKLLQNKSNIKLSLISDSECSNSDIEDDVRSIIDFEHETNCNKQIQNKKVDNIPVLTKSNRSIQYASSSDDEIYTKLRQNISKIENKTITCEQIKNQPFHEMYSSDDTSVSSSKSLQLNTTKINSINTFETHRCNIINNKFLNEKQNKVSMVNEESTNLQSSKCTNDKSKLLPNISCEKNNKIDLIKRILNEGSSSNDEINSKPLQIITNEIEKPNINDTRQISTSNVLKLNENTKTELNKDIVNPFIESHTQNISSISVDDASNFKSTKDKTKTYKPIKNQQFHELHSSDDESVSSFKLHGTSLKTLQSNTLKVNYVNEINTENCNIMSDKLLNKNSLKKQYKTLPVNEESTILQSPKFSDDKSKLLSNIMNCENNSKIDLIKKILEDSSSDNDINLKPSQIKIPDKSEINKSCSNQMPTSSVLKLNDNTKVLNENIVNPFIKFYTKNTSSSSEEDGSIIKLTKSKKNYSSKKKIVPSVKQEEDHKNVLINQLLSSIKHKEKKPKKKFFSEQINCNASLCRKPAKSKESKEDELKVKTKSKKDVLKKVITPVGESKSNKLTLDNTPNNIMLPSKIYISSNDGTDDEIDLIKKMMKSRKLKIKNDRSESIFSNNILTKPDKINATSEKTNRNFKSCKTPTILTNELISNNTKLKKKRPIESKDLLLNSILNSLGSSSDHYPPTKKKKKNEIIQLTDEFKDDYSEKSLSKSKKKKKDHNLVIEINEKNSGQLLSMSKKKKKNLDLVFEVNDKTKNKISNESIAKSKTKKKNHNLVIEINDEFKEKNSGQHLSMSKKKKNHDLVFEVNDKTKNKISNESIAKSKSKKKDHNLAIEINDTLKDKISDPSLAKFKKKKKNHSLVIETNDESKDKTSDQKASKSKKRKKNQNLVIDTNDELIDKNVFELKKKKKEKTKNSNYDILVKENKSQCYDSPAISHNELIREENLPIDVTKKKKKKKEVKKDSLLSDTQNPSITDILSTFEVELEDRNLNSQKEKKKKKKKKFCKC
ncbi:protein PF14_0175-like [Sipha flava]|uniref:Protein PF14_0175-like n=2 Tax=Sipha flava TaxID=143950 RepID=A0A8B8FBT3_9HEMI|nr:protein PF14_0175-like [Sipha flava]